MRVVVRADGGPWVGLGHVTRCLALAERLRERGAAVEFLTRTGEGKVLAKIEAAGCAAGALRPGPAGPQDVQALVAEVRRSGARAVVLDLATDSRHLMEEYQQTVKAETGARLLVIDDLARGRFTADVVLNQNIGFGAAQYQVEPHTRLLLGPRYALLRRTFNRIASLPRAAGGSRRVLVMMGGADPDNLTAEMLAALDPLPQDFSVDAVVGAAFRHLDALAAVAEKMAHPVELHHDPVDLPALMGCAWLAVSGGGSTCWELAYLGVPPVLLVLDETQERVAVGLAAAGFAVALPPAPPLAAEALRAAVAGLLADPERRGRMAARGPALVDGAGADRVASEVLAA